jgi:hypothetical protein
MDTTALEVKLVGEVRGCKTCKWFWGAIPPYGDFPRYDWNEDYPEAVSHQQQTTKRVHQKLLTGQACGQGQVEPGVMHGCRKAPIMTIGINPNMTSFYASDTGAQWCYPCFSKDARYAFYYRYHNVYQESFSLDLIREGLIKGSEIVAEKAGRLVSAVRSSDHRWMLLTIQYEGEEGQREVEVAWTDKERFVVLQSSYYSFKAGDIIGARIGAIYSANADIYENSTGYYQRYLYVLESFKELSGLTDVPLSICEDVAQHDMIACASPGWSSTYDIPTERITKNCVEDHGYLVSQLIQSRPSVIVIVGGSSLEMFARVFRPFLKGFEFEYEETMPDGSKQRCMKETFQLLKESTEQEKFLHIEVEGYELKARIMVSPHFSYGSNFEKHCRLSEQAWVAFENDFYPDAELLKQNKRIEENTWNDYVPIRLERDDALKSLISAAGWGVLMAYYYDPVQMLAEALQQEYAAGRIELDTATNHFRRPAGSCQFCVNDQWVFPAQCPYDKEKEPAPAPGELEHIVQLVIAAGTAVR